MLNARARLELQPVHDLLQALDRTAGNHPLIGAILGVGRLWVDQRLLRGVGAVAVQMCLRTMHQNW